MPWKVTKSLFSRSGTIVASGNLSKWTKTLETWYEISEMRNIISLPTYMWYAELEIEAESVDEAEEKYRSLFGDPKACPEISDSADFCIRAEEMLEWKE